MVLKYTLICITVTLALMLSVNAAVVKLAWDANAPEENVTGYNIYRTATPGSGYVRLTAVPVTVITYQDNVPNDGKTYEYVATAVNAAGESIFSNPVQYKAVPGAPKNLRLQ